MKNQFENPQAFPSKILDYSESSIQQRTVYEAQNEGMTLRDYFAAKALSIHPINAHHVTEIAQYAYGIADAMLKERSK